MNYKLVNRQASPSVYCAPCQICLKHTFVYVFPQHIERNIMNCTRLLLDSCTVLQYIVLSFDAFKRMKKRIQEKCLSLSSSVIFASGTNTQCTMLAYVFVLAFEFEN